MTNPLYFVETRSPRIRGPWFLELDRDSNSREQVIHDIKTGQYDVVKILQVCEDEGSCRDVTAELMTEVEIANATDTAVALGAWTAADRQQATFDHARDERKHERV